MLVYTQEIHCDDGSVNTGVTTILPRRDWLDRACYAATFSFNGCGELTGAHWIDESGLLHSPVIITGSLGVGAAHQGVYEYGVKARGNNILFLPVVGETFDGHLHDITSFAVKPSHVVLGIESATNEAVKEGNTGGGTGIICHGYKGGTGSASRIVPGFQHDGKPKDYTVGVLVQANYGKMRDLRIGGVRVGEALMEDAARQSAEEDKRKDGSIIIVLATDAPLHSTQLQRLVKRATLGLGSFGGNGHNSSGGIFLAFSTGNSIPITPKENRLDPYKLRALKVEVVDDLSIDGLLGAAAEAVEEAIYNALCMAETMVGFKGRKIEALPLEKIQEMAKEINRIMR